MKHTLKITAILIIMFLITQLIGLAVVSFYQDGNKLPYGMEPPEENDPSLTTGLSSIFSALLIVIVIFFLLTRILCKVKVELLIKQVTLSMAQTKMLML